MKKEVNPAVVIAAIAVAVALVVLFFWRGLATPGPKTAKPPPPNPPGGIPGRPMTEPTTGTQAIPPPAVPTE